MFKAVCGACTDNGGLGAFCNGHCAGVPQPLPSPLSTNAPLTLPCLALPCHRLATAMLHLASPHLVLRAVPPCCSRCPRQQRRHHGQRRQGHCRRLRRADADQPPVALPAHVPAVAAVRSTVPRQWPSFASHGSLVVAPHCLLAQRRCGVPSAPATHAQVFAQLRDFKLRSCETFSCDWSAHIFALCATCTAGLSRLRRPTARPAW